MNSEENICNDASSAIIDVKRLRTEILEFEELHQIENTLRELESPVVEDLDEFKNRVSELLYRIYNLLNQIKNAPIQVSRPEEVLPLSILAQELKTQIEWLEGMLTHLQNMIFDPASISPSWVSQNIQKPLKSALSKIKSYLLPFIKKFLSKLWSIISGLLTPKDWKIKGKVGTGLLGLADVEVEVTFGP